MCVCVEGGIWTKKVRLLQERKPLFLEQVARPGFLPEWIRLLAGEPHDQVILH